eukprot:5293826-Prymnesium_polylepis.1
MHAAPVPLVANPRRTAAQRTAARWLPESAGAPRARQHAHARASVVEHLHGEEEGAALARVLGEHDEERHRADERRHAPLVHVGVHKLVALDPRRVLGGDAARDVEAAEGQPLERRHAHLGAVALVEDVDRLLADALPRVRALGDDRALHVRRRRQ